MDSYKVFATVLDTEEDAPDIIWNMDMRKRLLDHLTSELEMYVRARASDSKALYVHTPRAPIYYPELAGKFTFFFCIHCNEWLLLLIRNILSLAQVLKHVLVVSPYFCGQSISWWSDQILS